MPVKYKINTFLLIILGVLLLLPAMVGAAAPITLTLSQAKELAMTKGTSYLLLQLSHEQAGEALNLVRRQYGLGAEGIADSRTLKKQIDELEAIIDEKLEKIKLLEKDIASWKEEQAELEKGGSGVSAKELAALQGQIEHAYKEIAEHQRVLDGIRPAHASMVPRYYQTKSLEDMARPQLNPAAANVDAVADALLTQPKVIDYNVERLFLNLLALQKQGEYLETSLAFLQKMEKREALLQELGLSTSLKLAAAGTAAQRGEETLTSLRASEDNLKRTFLSLLGLPLDFDFSLQPVESGTTTINLAKTTDPDLTQSVRYLRAKSNLQTKIKDLNDTSKSDTSRYRIAEVAVREAEINLENALKQLRSNYESRRDSLLLAQKALDNAGAALENTRKSLKQAELKYRLGTIARVELEQQELALEEAELRYRSAQNDHYLAIRAYLLAREGIELP